MKLKIAIVLLTVCIGTKAQTNCENAVAIQAGLHNAVFVNGSTPPVIICTNGVNNMLTKGIWYSYTPTSTYTTSIRSSVTGYPDTDTRLHVYSGVCNNLVCVTGDDDSGNGTTALATFTAVENTTYFIVFDDNWSNENFVFNLQENTYVPQPFTPQYFELEGSKCAIADLNGDYLDDIISPTIVNSVNVLYQNPDGGAFIPQTLSTPTIRYRPSWSIAVGDYDNNGYNDLLYGDSAGASLVLANSNGTAFNTLLESSQYIFSQRTNFVDINNDGHLDAFVCHDFEPNCYFLNDGNSGFTFHQGGLGDYPTGGNYGSIWVDYDNDGDVDLFIAKCRGGSNQAALDELLRNNGDGTFTNVAQQAGFADLHQSWSAAWADFDNDGDMDVMIGAYGGYNKLMRNDGNTVFTDVSSGSGLGTSTSNEHISHDFDNDGFVDLSSGSGLMHNNGDMTFSPVNVSFYAAAVGDLNNDGFLDILNYNAIYYGNPNGNNWIKILLQGTTSNRNGIGARVEILGNGDGWTKQIRDVRSGEGFKYMSSLNTHFGLGQTDALDMVVVKWPSGTVDYIPNPTINQSLMVVEGSFPLSRLDANADKFTLYPNPAKETLNIKSSNNFSAIKASIYSLDGKLAAQEDISNSAISVRHLTKGTYVIVLHDKNQKSITTKFIKE
ncbi:T9SS type A sorting domain-containing protein [Flavobacterium sp. Sd200]|uniref:FG-GAP-like repeat-containing protein n=1 Tax=Flavobacterium sp. Sd200 TaxID=2692211 RepID=UPI00136D57D4|nr:FG-GAP-like repeat-containing protein [Flavobacterium sp. Sd200]MXN92443.1 T9SS type A sorting domain-containing protein [Flavobacterium sp. Sd200]